MEGDEVKIARVLKEIGFSHLLQYFMDEEFTYESFQLLNNEIIREFLPKAGPRLLFWNKYTKYFQDQQQQRKRKSTPTPIYESDSDEPMSDPLQDTSDVYNIDASPTTEFVMKDKPEEVNFDFVKEEPNVESNSTYDHKVLVIKDVQPAVPNSSEQGSSVAAYLATAQGSLLYNKYNRNNSFGEKDRSLLARILIYKEFEATETNPEQKFKISGYRLRKLAEEVSEIFPTESPDIYFTPYNTVSKALSTGKLWTAYNCFKRQLKASKEVTVEAVSREEPENSTDVSAAISLLSDPATRWPDVLNNWQKTYKHRQGILNNSGFTLREYYEQFPVLKQAKGYTLLLRDFDRKFKDFENNFAKKWPTVNKDLIKIGEQKLNKSESGRIEATTPKDIRGFFYLPYLLPNAYLPKVSSMKRVRLSRAEIEQALIVFIQEGNDVLEYVRKDNEELEKLGIPMCPRLIFVGRSYLKITKMYIDVNLTLYQMQTAATAIETYLKVVMALNSTYPRGSKAIWTFIQQHVFDIKTDRDSSYTSVNVLINELRAKRSK